jgi:hypothetical protein
MSVALRRQHSQLLAGNALGTAHAVVSHFGAIQAQDYLGALWAVGARMRKAVESDVEKALATRQIVRCWPMRGTLHFVAAEDVRWMLELLAPRVLARHRPRLEREFDLGARVLARSRIVVERALEGGHALTRSEVYAVLAKARISTASSRGLHILFALAHERVICFGARRGKQPTFVLLDEWVPPAKPTSREESIAELGRRYFRSHGPATLADFSWWSGLTQKEAKTVAIPRETDVRVAKPNVHLLPPFDEATVAYKDRGAIVDPAFPKRATVGGGILDSVILIDGVVTGTWKRTLRGAKSVEIARSLCRALTAREERAVEKAAARYARFLGLPGSVIIS